MENPFLTLKVRKDLEVKRDRFYFENLCCDTKINTTLKHPEFHRIEMDHLDIWLYNRG